MVTTTRISVPDLVAAENRRDRRREVFELLTGVQWEVTPLERQRKCLRVSRMPAGEVVTRYSPELGIAGTAGLVTCNSPSSCVRCSPKIAAGRIGPLAGLFEAVVVSGGSIGFLTLTAQHHFRPLREMSAVITRAWQRARGGRGWVTARKVFGVAGYVRSLEVTHSWDNGFHPHQHVALIFREPVSEGMGRELAELMWRPYFAELERHGYTADRDGHGLDYRASTSPDQYLAEYLVKQLGPELALGMAKRGRRNSRTMLDVLRLFRDTGDLAELDVWVEYVLGMRGKRTITTSNGLFRAYGLEEDKRTDDEVAEEQLGGRDELILAAETFRRVKRRQSEMLDVRESQGLDAFRRWVEDNGGPYRLAPDLAEELSAPAASAVGLPTYNGPVLPARRRPSLRNRRVDRQAVALVQDQWRR